MSYLFFGIGFIIFFIYIVFLVWNIVYNGNKQQQENYPNMPKLNDEIDMDGIGNQGRIPNVYKKTKKRKKIFGSNKRHSVWDL